LGLAAYIESDRADNGKQGCQYKKKQNLTETAFYHRVNYVFLKKIWQGYVKTAH
jgi:hypothetical protein